MVAKEKYSAFGERRRGETTLITDQLYTGQRLNVLSNLYHYTDGSSAGRFYDPLLARFIQADSVTPGTTSIALNRYAYANNSPTTLTDPTGHACAAPDDTGIVSPALYHAYFPYDPTLDQKVFSWLDSHTDYNTATDPLLSDAGAWAASRRTAPLSREGITSLIEDQRFAWVAGELSSGREVPQAALDIGIGNAATAMMAGVGAAREFNIAPYRQQPSPRLNLDAHHVIQDAWAKNNVAGYDQQMSRAAPSILLEGGRHDIISAAQQSRANTREAAGLGKWSSTMREEFNYAVRDMRTAGVPQQVIQRAIMKAYRFFYP